MKGLAFRKLSRTSSHRSSLLRNLVTSLLHHERISTTVAKAKEAQRQAEKVITLGKKIQTGNPQARYTALSKIYSPETTLPILKELASRYSTRPGGYTRLHLHGNRKGDHAPRALLELVDGPKDMKIEITSRAMGREAFLWEKEQLKLKSLGLENGLEDSPLKINVQRGESSASEKDEAVESEREGEGEGKGSPSSKEKEQDEYSTALLNLSKDTRFSPLTRKSISEISKIKGKENLEKLLLLSSEHYQRLKAIEDLEGTSIPSSSSFTPHQESLKELVKSGNGPRGINDASQSLDEKLQEMKFGSVTMKGQEKKLKAGMIADGDYYGSIRTTKKNQKGSRERLQKKSVLKVARGVFVKRKWNSNPLVQTSGNGNGNGKRKQLNT